MADTLKVVMAGCGKMSGAWLKAAAELEGVRVAGLVDLHEAAARERAAEYGLEDAVVGTELPRVLDQVQPDIVFDCTVPEAHTAVTLAALSRGCHVLGEKPMADSMENARKALEAAQQAGRLYAVIQNRRYIRPIRRLRAFLESGVLGPLTTANVDFYIGAHFGGFRDRMEHVLLVDMAIHTFDMARFLTGADPVSVYCKEWNPSGSWYDHDASAVAVFEMTGGLVFTYRGSWCSEGRNTTWEGDWRIVGQEGSVTWDGADGFRAEAVAERGGFFSTLRDVEVSDAPPGSKEGGHSGIIREFVECVRSGGTPETVCTDNIKSLAMVFAAVESAESGREVRVEW